MKNLKSPFYLIVFVAVPQLALLVSLFAGGAFASAAFTPPAVAAHALLSAAAGLALAYGILKRRSEKIAPPVLAALAALQIVGDALFVTWAFALPFTQNTLSVEVAALFAGAVSLLYLCVQLFLLREDTPAKTLWRHLGLTVLLPFACAMAFNSSREGRALNTVLLNLGIALLCAAAVFFARWILTFLRGGKPTEDDAERPKSGFAKAYGNWVVILIAAILLPPAGLLANWSMDGMFGDFSSPWFPVIAAVNGILMLPVFNRRFLSLPTLYFKAVGFSLIAYMATLFVPFLPVGFIGIVFCGLGLLVFVPLFVMILEIGQLAENAKKLRARWNAAAIALVIVAGALTIPAVFAANAYADRVNYQNAQAYLYPDKDRKPVDMNRLSRAIREMDRRDFGWAGFSLFGTNPDSTPVFSALYRDIVFEGRVLSAQSANQMCAVFFDDQSPVWQERGFWSFSGPSSVQETDVELKDAAARTEYDAQNGVYKTWVDLELYNAGDFDAEEYVTRFNLPAGCFISDYYLYVGDARKFGMLADKRAAQITYEGVVRRSRDPGIVFYADRDTIELRVFPFSEGETRKTGFCVTHSQPETLSIDGSELLLDAPQSDPEPLDMGSAVFVPAAYKENLEAAQRRPMYWFVADTSENSPVAEHIRKIQYFADKNGISEANVVFASYRTQTVRLSDLPESPPAQARFDMTLGGERVSAMGGFNLGAAMRMAQNETQKEDAQAFPVIIAVSDNIASAALPENMQEYECFPESEYYYNLNYDASLTPYGFANNEAALRTVAKPIVSGALRYQDVYVGAKPQSEVVYRRTDPAELSFGENAYQNAFLLTQKTLLLPGEVDVVRDSFRQKTLTPATAFTVFETAEQEAELLRAQEEILNGASPETDAVNAPRVTMDESVSLAAALAAALGSALVLRLRRGRKKIAP